MKRLILTLVSLALLIAISPVHAGTSTPSGRAIMRLARASIVVPAQWDGLWTTVDSVYDCPDVFLVTNTSTDTICGGREYSPDGQGSPFAMVCTGSADASTMDMTCTGSGEVFAGCNANYTMVTHGTISGDTYHMVSTMETTYSGTGEGCSLLPPSCTQIDIWGTRTGAAPTDYCATSVRKSTWGRVKSLYR